MGKRDDDDEREQGLPCGPVFNVTDYGATGDGVTDDTDAINDALGELVDLGYGTLCFPPGVYAISSTLVIGNGGKKASTAPTNIRIQGSGSVSGVTLSFPLDGVQTALNPMTSRITFIGTGSTANTCVVKIPGAIDVFSMADIEIDGANTAGIGIALFSLSGGTFDKVLVRDCTYAGVWFTSNGYQIGATSNQFNNCGVVSTVNCGATRGIVFGGTPSDVTKLNAPSPGGTDQGPLYTWGTQFNQFHDVGIWLMGSTGSVAVDLRDMDSCSFFGGSLAGNAGSVQMSQNPNRTTFPGPCYFFGCNISSSNQTNPTTNFLTNGAFTFTPGLWPSWVIPFGDNGFNVPLNVPWITGMTIAGQVFGPINNTGASLLMTARGGFAAAVNSSAETVLNPPATGCSYSLPPNMFMDSTIGVQNGAMLRIRASGVYSTKGTPALDIKLNFNGLTIVDTGQVTTIANASSAPWQLTADLLVNNSANTIASMPQFAITGNFQPATVHAIPTGLSAGGPIEFSAQWSAADPGNTVTMQSYTVELLKSQQFA